MFVHSLRRMVRGTRRLYDDNWFAIAFAAAGFAFSIWLLMYMHAHPVPRLDGSDTVTYIPGNPEWTVHSAERYVAVPPAHRLSDN